ncbi:MAG: biotin--[acetyl-CoA-carboxylase] ligase [Ruminococcaceae bacterium]|nr:biotin--[acetyl-CoA-carboxylase] ligase [Oscillospiraceae bacterium]
MSHKDEILKLLYFYSSDYITADTLGCRIGISRKEVLRYIDELRNDGYYIHGLQNRGYALGLPDDILSPIELSKYYRISPEKIRVFSSLPSTNTTAKEMASRGAPEGTVIIAEKQTCGRGRMNRVFFSPQNSGLYMSIILRPKLAPKDSLLITTMAAVAVAEAAEKLTMQPMQIKWVNDVYFREKKIAGILTEASYNAKKQETEYLILGIGVNVYRPQGDFPEEIQNIAGTLFDLPVPHGRCRMAALILEHFFHYYNSIEKKEFLEPYRNRCILSGRNVKVMRGEENFPARVLGINEDFSLHIERSNGKEENLSSGEVSIKI